MPASHRQCDGSIELSGHPPHLAVTCRQKGENGMIWEINLSACLQLEKESRHGQAKRKNLSGSQ